MTVYVVYKHTNIINNKVYVGQVSKPSINSNDPERLMNIRWQQHCNDALRGSKSIFHKAIRKHGKNAFKHDVIGVYQTLEESLTAEAYWIKELMSMIDQNGYNMTSGGEGYVVSDQTRQKMRVRGKEVMSRPEVLKKVSKQVAQINPDTNQILMIYSSAREATKKTGINHGNICSAARNNNKQIIGGYTWQYVDDKLTLGDDKLFIKHDSRHKGSQCHQTKFSESDVIELRKLFQSVNQSKKGEIMKFCNEHASRLSVTSRAIHNIIRNKTWKHI